MRPSEFPSTLLINGGQHQQASSPPSIACTMPPRKKVKKITFEQLQNDIQNSELEAGEYEKLAELCKEKADELQENKCVASITTIIRSFYDKFENKLKELEEEEYNKEDEDEVADHESAVETATRGKDFFEKLQAISAEYENRDLEYDRYEGSLASETNIKLTLEYEDNAVEFHRIVRHSSYGGENSRSIEMSHSQRTLEKMWNLSDIEEFGEFMNECFDSIARENNGYVRETDFYSEVR